MLIGHEQWLDVIQLLKVVLNVDEVDVLHRLGLAHGDASLLANEGKLLRELFV